MTRQENKFTWRLLRYWHCSYEDKLTRVTRTKGVPNFNWDLETDHKRSHDFNSLIIVLLFGRVNWWPFKALTLLLCSLIFPQKIIRKQYSVLKSIKKRKIRLISSSFASLPLIRMSFSIHNRIANIYNVILVLIISYLDFWSVYGKCIPRENEFETRKNAKERLIMMIERSGHGKGVYSTVRHVFWANAGKLFGYTPFGWILNEKYPTWPNLSFF